MTIYLPLTKMAHYMSEHRVPMGIVHLPALAGSISTSGSAMPPQPERDVPVLLELYYARAYPGYYYTSPVQVDVTVRIAVNV